MPNYFNPYQNFYQPQPQPQMQMQAPQQQATMPQAQMQNGGFMLIPSIQDARNYPVAPGNVMTFKVENEPVVCEKAQGFSQLEGPVFTKYRLVKEEVKSPETAVSDNQTVKVSYDELKAEIEDIKGQIRALKEQMQKEVVDDE